MTAAEHGKSYAWPGKLRAWRGPDRPRLLAGWCIVLVAPLSLAVGYFVIIVSSLMASVWYEQPSTKMLEIQGRADTLLKNTKCGWIIVLVLISIAISLALYFAARKYLMERHRLRFISGYAIFGEGLAAIAMGCIVLISVGAVLFAIAPAKYDDSQFQLYYTLLFHSTVILFAACLSTVVLHFIEYGSVASMFADNESLSLAPAIHGTLDAQRERLRLLENYQFSRGSERKLDLDFLPDREQPLIAMTAMLSRLNEQLNGLMKGEYDELIIAECDGFIAYDNVIENAEVGATSAQQGTSETTPNENVKENAEGGTTSVQQSDSEAAPIENINEHAEAGAASAQQGTSETTPLMIKKGGFTKGKRPSLVIVSEEAPKGVMVAAGRYARYYLSAQAHVIVDEGAAVKAGEILARIKRRSIAGEASGGMRDLLRRYGNVAALFHPDYLPHLSHTYLKLSQMRALNMPPRRIQLLGRQWTLRGLESEYVVVHDVSEERSEYMERAIDDNEPGKPPAATADKRVGEPSTVSGASAIPVSSGGATQPTMQGNQARDTSRIKWRARPLKKRARVVVAPDGSLLRIAIEEERQFNI